MRLAAPSFLKWLARGGLDLVRGRENHHGCGRARGSGSETGPSSPRVRSDSGGDSNCTVACDAGRE